jgi:hypothetical protein
VTSVGGTQLHLDAAGNRIAPDNVWNDIPIGIDAPGGGGPSHVFPRPLSRGDNTFTLLDDNGNPVFTVPGYTAVPGYDMASGLGTVDALQFTHALANR